MWEKVENSGSKQGSGTELLDPNASQDALNTDFFVAPEIDSLDSLMAPQLGTEVVAEIDEIVAAAGSIFSGESSTLSQALEELQSARMAFILQHDASGQVHLSLAENFLLITAKEIPEVLELSQRVEAIREPAVAA